MTIFLMLHLTGENTTKQCLDCNERVAVVMRPSMVHHLRLAATPNVKNRNTTEKIIQFILFIYDIQFL
ncbi:hypothetical protein IFT68_13250 [Oxalobacteraceae sp. CFBP 13730]|nr:hypothetical protein [Oxalobacteraceae sp. CFBP 13730]